MILLDRLGVEYHVSAIDKRRLGGRGHVSDWDKNGDGWLAGVSYFRAVAIIELSMVIQLSRLKSWHISARDSAFRVLRLSPPVIPDFGWLKYINKYVSIASIYTLIPGGCKCS